MIPYWGAEFLFVLLCLCKGLRLESLSIVSHLDPLSSGRQVTHPDTTASGVLKPPMHHPLLDELLKLFSGSQMSRTKPYIVTMIVISFFFFHKKEPFLEGISLISENDRSHFDTGHSEKVGKWDGL